MKRLFGRRSDDIKSIEVSTKHLTLRVVLFSTFLVLGIGAIIYGLTGLFSEEGGWQTVEAVPYASADCSDEFNFQYELGAGELSPKTEYGQLSQLYGQVTAKTYQLFHQTQLFEDVNNVAYLNAHPNEKAEVDEVLYNAFELLEKADSRQLFLAPYWEYYSMLFSCSEDSDAGWYDPKHNKELEELFLQISEYVSDPRAVSLELYGDNQVCLRVSEEYLQFARENDIYCFIDFHFMKNAFIIDCIAGELIQGGFTHGVISSFDGFYRDLDDRDTWYSLNLFDRKGNTALYAAAMDYTKPLSIVSLRTFSVSESDLRYYAYSNGETRFPYLDMQGNCLAAESNLVCYSDKAGCARLLLEMIPAYISDSLETGGLTAEYVYCRENVIYCSDKDIELRDICDGYEMRIE